MSATSTTGGTQSNRINSTGAGTFIKNKNYRKLSQKLTKIILFTPKIAVYCRKLIKILLKRRIKLIKLNQIKKQQNHRNLLNISDLSKYKNKLTHQ